MAGLNHLSSQQIVNAMSAVAFQMDAIIGRYKGNDTSREFVFYDDCLEGNIPVWNALAVVYSRYESELKRRNVSVESAIDKMGLHVYQS